MCHVSRCTDGDCIGTPNHQSKITQSIFIGPDSGCLSGSSPPHQFHPLLRHFPLKSLLNQQCLPQPYVFFLFWRAFGLYYFDDNTRRTETVTECFITNIIFQTNEDFYCTWFQSPTMIHNTTNSGKSSPTNDAGKIDQSINSIYSIGWL